MHPAATRWLSTAGAAFAAYALLYLTTFTVPGWVMTQVLQPAGQAPFSTDYALVGVLGSGLACLLVGYLSARLAPQRKWLWGMAAPTLFFLYSMVVFLPYASVIPWPAWYPYAMVIKVPLLAPLGVRLGIGAKRA